MGKRGDDRQTPAASGLAGCFWQSLAIDARAMIADLDTHRLPADADGYMECGAGAAAVAHGVGDEFSDKQLRVA